MCVNLFFRMSSTSKNRGFAPGRITASWEIVKQIVLLAYSLSTQPDSFKILIRYQHDFAMKGGGFEIPPSFNPKKGPSHEQTTQVALTMLPIGLGCAVGGLTCRIEKRCLYNTLGLREADFCSSAILLK